MSAEEKKIAVRAAAYLTEAKFTKPPVLCSILPNKAPHINALPPILNKRRSLTIIPKALSRTKAETCWSKRPVLPAATSKAWPTLIPIFLTRLSFPADKALPKTYATLR